MAADFVPNFLRDSDGERRVVCKMNTKLASLLAATIGAIVLVLSDSCAWAADTNAESIKYDILIENGAIRVPSLLDPRADFFRYKATLGDVIDYVFRVRFTNANFVLSPGLRDVPLSDMKLANAAHLMLELEAVDVASGNKFKVRRSDPAPSEADSGTFLLEANPAAFPVKDSGKNVEAFNLSSLSKKSVEAEEKTEAARAELFSLSQQYGPNHPLDKSKGEQLEQLMRSQDVAYDEEKDRCDYIERAVDGTLEQMGVAGKPTFKYHVAIHLLVVIGTQEQLDVARKMVNALLDKPAAPASPVPVPPSPPQP